MEYRTLGRTGLKVSCVGFGGIPLAGLTVEEAGKVLNRALDLGINFIDTARGYKESESLIGSTISKRRKEFYLATKTRARDEEGILKEYGISSEYLKTDYFDLYQIHYVNTEEELELVMKPGGPYDVLYRLRDEGKIGYIGITGHDDSVLMIAAKTGKFDTIQGAFSFLEKEQKIVDLIHFCDKNKIGFICQKPLAGGAILNGVAGLKWILHFPVSTVIPGMSNVEQVEQNVAAGSPPFDLSTDEMNALDEIASKLDKYFCRRCYYCHPVCPENIRIGVILEFYGKAQFPENLQLARRWYQGFKINAANCTECGLCLPECPYGLPIIDMLKEAHALLGVQ